MAHTCSIHTIVVPLLIHLDDGFHFIKCLKSIIRYSLWVPSHFKVLELPDRSPQDTVDWRTIKICNSNCSVQSNGMPLVYSPIFDIERCESAFINIYFKCLTMITSYIMSFDVIWCYIKTHNNDHLGLPGHTVGRLLRNDFAKYYCFKIVFIEHHPVNRYSFHWPIEAANEAHNPVLGVRFGNLIYFLISLLNLNF